MPVRSQAVYRFLCFGVGAVGIYLGSSLAKQGHQVVFIDRPENADQVRKKGLTLFTPQKAFHVGEPDIQPTIERALTHGPFDAVIFAVKGYDTSRVLKYLRPYQVALPAFICIQNGIGNEAQLVELFGPEKVIPAVMTTSVRKIEPGVAEVLFSRGIGISGQHQLIPAIIGAMNQAGLHIHTYRDPASMKWSKLLLNLMTNASSAILRMTPEEIIHDPDLRVIEIRQIQEALLVMRSQNLKVINLPGYPLQWINLLMNDGISEKIRDHLLERMVVESWGSAMPLLSVDILGGKTESEVQYMNGAVVRHGNQSGVPAPINAALTEMLTGIVDGHLDADQFIRNKEAFLGYIGKITA